VNVNMDSGSACSAPPEWRLLVILDRTHVRSDPGPIWTSTWILDARAVHLQNDDCWSSWTARRAKWSRIHLNVNMDSGVRQN